MASCLFLGKPNDELAARAGEYVRTHFQLSEVHFCNRGGTFPAISEGASFDFILSYLCPLVVPERVLRLATRAAINFHPGPPEYPGIGCTNFAIYHMAAEFGVTCHHMAARVDSGPIIRVMRFPLRENDSVLTLTQRCHANIALLFYEIADLMLKGAPLPVSNERWTRKAYTRTDFKDLLRLRRDMSEEEIRRRVRATTYPGYPAASFGEGSDS